eukprot:2404238-Rhodomonas_salina.2
MECSKCLAQGKLGYVLVRALRDSWHSDRAMCSRPTSVDPHPGHHSAGSVSVVQLGSDAGSTGWNAAV